MMNKLTRLILLLLLTGITLTSVAATKLEYLKVTNVKHDDVLSMRATDSAKATLLQRISYDAKGLLLMQRKGQWVKVAYQGHVGWVHSKFVTSTTTPSFKKIFNKEMDCSGTEPFWSIKTDKTKLFYKTLMTSSNKGVNYQLDSDIAKGWNLRNIWHASARNLKTGQHIRFIITSDKSCSDDMSETKYNYKIHLITDQKHLLVGCCK